MKCAVRYLGHVVGTGETLAEILEAIVGKEDYFIWILCVYTFY